MGSAVGGRFALIPLEIHRMMVWTFVFLFKTKDKESSASSDTGMKLFLSAGGLQTAMS